MSDKELADTVADYVVDYPRFEESANEVAELILDAVLDKVIEVVNKQYEMYQKADWTGTPRYSNGIVKAIEDLKVKT